MKGIHTEKWQTDIYFFGDITAVDSSCRMRFKIRSLKRNLRVCKSPCL